ncbi:MAG: leucine-rich repeat domain-containing protein [Lachnospiraceae bacterium]|nr:leucine-rich repeat domain-containing protein [Lachnospiraceae bacterium]
MRKMNYTKLMAIALAAVTTFGTVTVSDIAVTNVYADEAAGTSNNSVAVKENETGKCGDNATYTIDRKNKKITISGKGAMWDDPKIPISENDDIEEIVVEEGITVIGKNSFRAFYNKMSKLKNVYYGIKYDGIVKKVVLPSTLTEIHSRAFTYVSYIKVPESVNRVDYDAFDGVQTIEIMGDMKGYEKYAITSTFSNAICPKIILHGSADDLAKAIIYREYEVQIANGNEKIKWDDGFIVSADNTTIYGIDYDSSREVIKINDNVKKIHPYAFSGMYKSKVRKIILGKNVEEIGKCAFMGNKICIVELNDKLRLIGESAFTDNEIDDVIITSNVNLENNAFDDNVTLDYETNFKNIHPLFNAAEVDKKTVFVRCNRIEGANGYEVKITKGNMTVKYTTKRPSLLKDISKKFNNTDDILITVRAYKLKGKKKVYSASNTIIQKNEDMEFDNYKIVEENINMLDLINSLSIIDGRKVYIASSTSSEVNEKGIRVYHPSIDAKFPEVKEDYIVENGAKYSVDGKTLLSAPMFRSTMFVKTGVEKINISALLAFSDVYEGQNERCKILLRNIILPKSVKKIVDDEAIALSYMKKTCGYEDKKYVFDFERFEKMRFENYVPNPNPITQINVRGTKLSAKQMIKLVTACDNVKADNFIAPKKVAKYDNGMFIYKNILMRYSGANKKLMIPEGVKEISDNAISKIRYYELLDNVNGDYFITSGNNSIKEVIFPKSLMKIGSNAFAKCQNLKRVTISSKLKEIGDESFSGCKKLKKVTLNRGSKIGKIGFAAFDSSVIFKCKTKINNAKVIISDSYYPRKNLGLEIDYGRFVISYNKIVGADGYEIKLAKGNKSVKYTTVKAKYKGKIPRNFQKGRKPIKVTVRAYKYYKNKKVYTAPSKVTEFYTANN